MMVMVANNSAALVHHWSGKYEGRIGWLVGPEAMAKTKLRAHMPFALDNDAFTAWRKKRAWNHTAWRDMLEAVRLSGLRPLWSLVPDVVASRDGTLAAWNRHHKTLDRYRYQKAFAVQDGMTPADIPDEAAVIFVGATTAWKWQTLPTWAAQGLPVHVGRVNELDRLWICERHNVQSVDGTGWMRATTDGRQGLDLERWLSGEQPQPELPFVAELQPQIIT